MGILSSILKSVVGSVLGAQNEGVDRSTTTPPKSDFSGNVYQPKQPPYNTEYECLAYFESIIRREYPLLTVRREVPVTDIVGYAEDVFKLYETRPYQTYKAEWGKPYTFALYEGPALKAVVMLGDGHTHSSNVKYLIARKYAQKVGVPYINFYTQMSNEHDYVVSRLHRFL